MALSSVHQAGVPSCLACCSSHVSTSETEGSVGVVLYISFGACFYFGAPEGYSPSWQGSIWEPGAYIPCAVLGVILNPSSAVAPRLTPGPGATSTLGCSFGNKSVTCPFSSNSTFLCCLGGPRWCLTPLWCATLRASLYDPCQSSLSCSSWSSWSLAVVEYPHLCNRLFREESISWIAFLLN